MSFDLLIAGASARAAANSAVRAGLRVAAADLFADRDLLAIADTTAITDWPAGIERWAASFDPSVPFLPVGGLENHPALLERIAATRPVLGPTGGVLHAIRTPERLAALLDEHELPRPALLGETVHERATNTPRRWLVKPRHSAAGHGIAWHSDSTPVGDDRYVQEFVEGSVGSAAFLASSDRIELLGVTDLLLPDPTLAEIVGDFTYCGSLSAATPPNDQLERVGRCVASTGLRGLFGVDFVKRLTRDGDEFLPIEVNPRYTAGMEVLERRSGRSFLGEHFAVWNGERTESLRSGESETANCHGKRIVYARLACKAGDLLPHHGSDRTAPASYPAFADIPHPGTSFPAGAPVCTVFATAPDRASCLERLAALERRVLRLCEPE